MGKFDEYLARPPRLRLLQLGFPIGLIVGVMVGLGQEHHGYGVPRRLKHRLVAVEDGWQLNSLSGRIAHTVFEFGDMKTVMELSGCRKSKVIRDGANFFDHFKRSKEPLGKLMCQLSGNRDLAVWLQLQRTQSPSWNETSVHYKLALLRMRF